MVLSPDGGNLINGGGIGVNLVTSMRNMPATATALISPMLRSPKPTAASIHSMAQRKLDSLCLETSSLTKSEMPARDHIVKGPMKRRTPRSIQRPQSSPPTIQYFHHSWHNYPLKVNSFNQRPAPHHRRPVGENDNNIKNSSSSNSVGNNNNEKKKPQQHLSSKRTQTETDAPTDAPTDTHTQEHNKQQQGQHRDPKRELPKKNPPPSKMPSRTTTKVASYLTAASSNVP